MIGSNLPALPLVLLLLAAPLCLVLRRRGLVYPLAAASCWSVLAMCGALLQRVLDEGTLSYSLGGWPAPWGIEYRVDALNAVMLVLVSLISAIVISYAPRSLAREIAPGKEFLFYAAYLLCVAGLLGIAITGDMFNLFVFLEISSLSSYALISQGSDRRCLTAAFQYLIMGTIGATFILIAIGLMYMMTGTLNMADVVDRLRPVMHTRTVHAAFAFLTVGVGLKMAFFPLHLWLPNAYAYAPSVVTSFLAATATKVSVYVFLRFVFTIYGETFSFETLPLDAALLPLALIGIFVTSTVAIFQTDVKRMLAYSSVAQIGYIVLGISLASVSGLTAGIVHVLNHALIKGGMFMALGCMAYRVGSVEISDLHGIGRRMPWTTFAWVLGGLGLIGVPLTAGFISKLYLIRAALEGGWWIVAFLVLLSSLLAAVYVWRVVEVAYFKDPPKGGNVRLEAPASMLLPTCLLIATSLYFGLRTEWTVGLARRAAELLLGIAGGTG